MRQQAAIDGFQLAYERTGSGPAVLLLHGWPGDRTDYRAVVPLVSRAADVIVPALVIAPPLPGIGDRILAPQAQREFWYQAFHNLGLPAELVDGQPDAVRAYLRHFWSHWSGPAYEPDDEHLDHLVSVYGPPGAFTASIAWYRAGAGSVAASLAEKAPAPQDRITVT